MNKRETGNIYEQKADELVLKSGYEILEKNFRSYRGEIDLICCKDKEIVFIEVKYRRTKDFGEGFESVDHKKIKKIYRTAQLYISNIKDQSYTYRFDCISFLNDKPKWMTNVIWGDEFGL